MIPLVPLIVLLAVAFVWGVWDFFVQEKPEDDGSGWVYFIGDGPENPIKVGMSKYDPSTERLTELRTMSPTPLRVIYKFPCRDRYGSEAMVHHQLAPYRLHGEWFDRDATLALIANLRGEYQ